MSKFILYSYYRSSASYRVRIALNLKKIAYEYRAVHLLNNGGEQHQDAYTKLNPSHEVPTLVHEGHAIAQSLAIIDYLDQIAPSPRLISQDPLTRARIWQACEIINSGAQPVHNLRVLNELGNRFKASAEQKDDWARHWIDYGLTALETLLSASAEKFSFGDQLTASDCCLVPQVANAVRFKVSMDKFPTLARINRNCLELTEFRRAAPDSQPDFPAEPPPGR